MAARDAGGHHAAAADYGDLHLAEDSLGPVVAHCAHGAKLAVDVFDRTAQNRIASGKLLTLDNQIDTTTGTVKARAIFDNKDDALFPNQFVNTRLLVNTLQGVTLIPRRPFSRTARLVRLCDSEQCRAPAHREGRASRTPA